MIRTTTLVAIAAAGHLYAVTTTVDVAILHTTDLHSHRFPTTDYEGTGGVGGIYQIAPVLTRLRQQHSAAILVDNGDAVVGTLGDSLDQGASFIGCMNALDIAVMNIGNHEFDRGVEALAANLACVSGTVVCANLHWSGSSPSPFGTVRPFVVRELAGMRIAFVGLTHPKVPFWTVGPLLKGTVIEPPVQALQRIMPLVQAEQPDAIILLAHMGFAAEPAVFEPGLAEVLQQFPDIAVVIGGHTHRCVTNIMVGSTLFTQAGYHGIMLGEVTLVFDAATRSLKERRTALHGIGPNAPQSVALKALNAAADAREDVAARKPLCAIDGTVGGTNSVAESPDQTLICEALAAADHAEVVFHGSFGDAPVVSNRTMTMGDLFSLMPYDNRFVTMHLTAEEIRVMLDALVPYWGTHRFAFPYGLRATIILHTNEGARVASLHDFHGRALDSSRRYRVAFNSYMAASGGMRHMPIRAIADRASSRTTVSTVTTRDAVASFLCTGTNYTPHVVTTIEVKGTTPARAQVSAASAASVKRGRRKQ